MGVHRSGWLRLVSEPRRMVDVFIRAAGRPDRSSLNASKAARQTSRSNDSQRVDLDRRYAVPTTGEMSVLGGCGCEAGDQLAAYLSRLDDGINDQLARQPQDVDV
jgi:hypothetical protein